MLIELNEAEQKLAKYVAKKRYENNRSDGTKNSKIGDQSDEATDLEGIAAEIAWCKVNNVYPDLTFDDGRPDADAVSRSGQMVDIKATKYKNGRLLAVRWKKAGGVNLYCLVIGEFPKYRIAGYMSADELLDESRLTNLGHGMTYAATQQELSGVAP